MQLFSLLFFGNVCGGQGFDGGAQSHDEGDLPQSPPTRENPAIWDKFLENPHAQEFLRYSPLKLNYNYKMTKTNIIQYFNFVKVTKWSLSENF